MILGISVLVLVITGFLTWLFWHHDLEVAFIVAICILVFEILFAVVAAPVYVLQGYTCSQVAEKMGVEHDFGFFTGCFIRDENGRWYNYSQQRIVK